VYPSGRVNHRAQEAQQRLLCFTFHLSAVVGMMIFCGLTLPESGLVQEQVKNDATELSPPEEERWHIIENVRGVWNPIDQ